jgi:hypothetical protein
VILSRNGWLVPRTPASITVPSETPISCALRSLTATLPKPRLHVPSVKRRTRQIPVRENSCERTGPERGPTSETPLSTEVIGAAYQ